ncbi:MAG: copper homeostasis protein CutC [Planctomycetota bacterium]|nr:MAG: copper homeostasis protein CutC [Planctomycetota bacterium]
MSKKAILIEACVSSVPCAMEAQRGGARRVELCDNLWDGGTTPSAGAIEAARRELSIGLNVIIRPRGGDFVYTELEMAIMRRDVELAKELGADGIVIGMLHPDGSLQLEQYRELIELARPMSVTSHRAFDMCRDPMEALEQLIELGVDRILSSGQRPSAMEGSELLAELVEKAGERILIMPGVGINTGNIGELIRRTGAREYHVFAQRQAASTMQFRNEAVFMGSDPDFDEFAIPISDAEAFREICRIAEASRA